MTTPVDERPVAPTVAREKQAILAVVRLGGESEDAINRIDSHSDDATLPFEVQIKCKQVPKELAPPAFAFIWLGTNNNKGGATPWVQGLRAFGLITALEGGPRYNDEKTVTISVGVVLGASLTKKDFIRATGDDYLAISDLPVIGINNYSSQVIQLINPAEDAQRVDVLVNAIDKLAPGFTSQVKRRYPYFTSPQSPARRVSESSGLREMPREPEKTLLEPPPSDDPAFTELLARVQRLLKDGFGGVALRGPPGTSKSYYARMIGAALADREPSRVRFVQFHPSYQYEDFVEGFVPDDQGVFRRKERHFLDICKLAESDRDHVYVLVIDEMSRTDPVRVLGEALTYIEASKRGETFQLASGRSMSVPPNLVVLATMNVWDRGIDEVDAALERRLAAIALDPSRETLNRILLANGVEDDLRERILRFFDALQRDPNPNVHIGHAYFRSVRDESGMHRLWNHQLRFVIERAFPLERDGFNRIERAWLKAFPEGSTSGPEPAATAPATADGREPTT